MAQVASTGLTNQPIAELEDTGTMLKTKTEEDSPPAYRTEKTLSQHQTASLKKETISPIDQKLRQAVSHEKQSVAAASDDKQALDTTLPQAVAGKEVAQTNPESNFVSSPTTTPLNTSSRLGSGFPLQASRSYREYSFWHTAPWRPTHNVITDPENMARYFVQVSEFSKGKSDVSIHDIMEGSPAAASKGDKVGVDEGKSSQIVAFAQFPHGNNNLVRLGLGDSYNMASVKWVNMKAEPDSDDWALFVQAGGPSQDTTKVYHFKSTKIHLSSSDTEPSTPATTQSQQSLSSGPSIGNYKFVDAESNASLAIYSENKLSKTWKKRGKLRMYEQESRAANVSAEEIELLVILCCAVTNEKRRRRTWRKWALIG